jgi:protein SCO1/2
MRPHRTNFSTTVGSPRRAVVGSPRRAVVGLAVAASLALLGCSSGDESVEPTASSDTSEAVADPPGDRELAGIVRDPAPVVDATTVPSLTEPGTDLAFRAEPGGFQSVYFGYTNCPDVCPTTMADWAVTLRRLPEDLAAQVSTVMVTVDPDRDNDILPGYVESFVADAEAAGTTDADRLAAAAEPFGVSYDVSTNDEGDIEVSHSGFLYLVDDQGRLVVTWPFGTSSSEMAADVEQLFAAEETA